MAAGVRDLFSMNDYTKMAAVREAEGWRIYHTTYNDYAGHAILKKAGAYWQRHKKAWTLEASELPPMLRELISLRGGAVYENVEAYRAEHKLEIDQIVSAPLPLTTEPEVDEPEVDVIVAVPGVPSAPGDFVQPSYWPNLMRYLTPSKSRPAIMLVGPAGNGKTTAAQKAMEARALPYGELDCTEYIEPADLVGGMSYNPNIGEVWRDGIVTENFREGRGTILNEFDALNPRAALCLQSALQDAGRQRKSRYVTTPGGPEDRVYPAGDCPIILTANTYGSGASRQYVGRNTLDAASMDRISIISTAYENEVPILCLHGYRKQTAVRLVSWALTMRSRIDENLLKVILSNRTLLRMAQGIQDYGWTEEEAIEWEFMGRLDPEYRDLLKGAS